MKFINCAAIATATVCPIKRINARFALPARWELPDWRGTQT